MPVGATIGLPRYSVGSTGIECETPLIISSVSYNVELGR